MNRRLIAEWRFGPLVIAWLWPPFNPKPKPQPRTPPRPVRLGDDEVTPVADARPITKAEEMP